MSHDWQQRIILQADHCQAGYSSCQAGYISCLSTKLQLLTDTADAYTDERFVCKLGPDPSEHMCEMNRTNQ